MAVVAGIDLGTNTVRLLVARFGAGAAFEEVYSEQRITRLGQDLRKTGNLVDDAMDRTVEAIRGFSLAMERFPVERVAVVATSAVRDAANRDVFIERVRSVTGHEVMVVPGDHEALLSYRGIRMSLDGHADNLVIVDIGGGSTEYVCVHDSAITGAVSLNMGVVHFTDGLLCSDPPTEGEIDGVRREVRHLLSEKTGDIGRNSDTRFVGTAGTVTTLAAIHQGMTIYDPARINNYTMTIKEIRRIFNMLAIMPIRERRLVPGLSPGREDLIIAGTIILLESMERFGFDRLVVSDYGLREGLVADLYDRLIAGADPSARPEVAPNG